MKHSTKYLYGELGCIWIYLQNRLANHKIYCCDRETKKITSVHPTHRDTDRFTVVKKAKNFNNDLLQEVTKEKVKECNLMVLSIVFSFVDIYLIFNLF